MDVDMDSHKAVCGKHSQAEQPDHEIKYNVSETETNMYLKRWDVKGAKQRLTNSLHLHILFCFSHYNAFKLLDFDSLYLSFGQVQQIWLKYLKGLCF